MKKVLNIKGMHCQNCVKRATKALEELDGVESVNVDLEKELANVNFSGEINEAEIREALKAVDLELVSITEKKSIFG